MRHRKAGKKLNRTSSHRKAMFANISVALIEHELIKTTLAKAKELRRVVEPMITRGAVDSVHNRRLMFAVLRDKAAVAKLFTVLGPRYESRPGGYLRILKCGFRTGDNAPMAYVELVDRGLTAEEAAKKKPATKKKAKKPAKKAEPEAPIEEAAPLVEATVATDNEAAPVAVEEATSESPAEPVESDGKPAE